MVNTLFALFFFTALSFSTAQAGQNDLKSLNQARIYFAEGKLEEAAKLYSAISADSDFWLDALEERAWAYTQQKKYEKALGDLKSVSNNFWASQVGPETMMLSAFVSLKLCAYKDVMKKVESFKVRMLPRIDALESTIQTPISSQLISYLQKSSRGSLKMSQLGKNAEKYPRYFFRDQALLSAFEKNDQASLRARMITLAERDLEEISKNLKKMKVLEVEVIQRVFTADDLKKSKEKLKFEKYDRNTQVSFPAEDEEVWVDEVGNYEVKAQQCPQ